MSAVDEILSALPIETLAQQVGASPDEVRQAVHSAVPALLGGMQANAVHDDGAASLAEAVGQHDAGLVDSGDLGRVDPVEGQKITDHVFGSGQDQIVDRLGALNAPAGGGQGAALVKKLLPLIAPMVMSYLAKQMSARSGATGSGAGGAINDVLEQVLKGAGQGAGGTSGSSGGPLGGLLGGALGDVLGGLLGGGRKK